MKEWPKDKPIGKVVEKLPNNEVMVELDNEFLTHMIEVVGPETVFFNPQAIKLNFKDTKAKELFKE